MQGPLLQIPQPLPPPGQWGSDCPLPLSAVEDLKSNSVSRSGRRPPGAALGPTPAPAGSPDSEPRVTLAPSRDLPRPGGSEGDEGKSLGE